MERDRTGTGGRGQHSTSDTGTATVDELAETLSALARDLEAKDGAPSLRQFACTASASSLVLRNAVST